ncbi:MAG: TIGR03619 family F420-dependent LLM class oxidoreductase [Myxococcota bacterium]
MDFWLTYIDEDPDHTIAVAKAAEAAGFRGIALADHVSVPVRFASRHPSGGPAPFDHRTDFPDPLVTAAAVLASTTRLLAMTYVYVLPMREPFSVASQVATLARLSGDRFRFGVGAGWLEEEIALLGQPVRGRGRRMDEMLEVLPRLWTEDAVAHRGEFLDFAPTGVAPKPRARVPIWVGGRSPAALARAARHDGWLGMNYDLDEAFGLLDALARARDARAAAGFAPPPRFETFLIPNAAPSRALYDRLEQRGVTSTAGAAWGYADRAFASLDAKLEAIAAFGRRIIDG